MSKNTSRSHHEGVKKQENWPNFFLMEPKEDLFIKNEQQKVKIFYESKLSIYLELLWNLHIEEEGYCNPTYIYIYIIATPGPNCPTQLNSTQLQLVSWGPLVAL